MGPPSAGYLMIRDNDHSMGTEQFSTHLEPRLASRVNELREKHDLSKSEVMRVLAREGLARRRKRREQFEQVVLALTLAAVFAIPLALAVGELWALALGATYGLAAVVGHGILWFDLGDRLQFWRSN